MSIALLDLERAGWLEMARSGNPSFEIEKCLYKMGYRIIAGVDEAGRGALAGPLSVGIVVYESKIFKDCPIELRIVRDSKLLSRQLREKAAFIIGRHSAVHNVRLTSHRKIDAINVNKATEYAIKRLLDDISPRPDVVILDGKFSFNLQVPYVPIRSGDKISTSIASASILAKVERDRVMGIMHGHYPEYGFDRNKGYGTREHMACIMEHGPSAIHRRSYYPIKNG